MGRERLDRHPDDSVIPIVCEKIYHIKAPMAPQFRFEWHPKAKKVYLIVIGAEPEIGEAFAHEIENEGAAWNAVLIWLRGYRTAKAEGALNVQVN